MDETKLHGKKNSFPAQKTGIFSAESPTCSSKSSAILHAYISSHFPTFYRPCPQLPPLRRQRSSSLLSRRKGLQKLHLFPPKTAYFFGKVPDFFFIVPLFQKLGRTRSSKVTCAAPQVGYTNAPCAQESTATVDFAIPALRPPHGRRPPSPLIGAHFRSGRATEIISEALREIRR